MNPLAPLRIFQNRFRSAFLAARHDRERGSLAEDLAKRWLTARGLEIVGQNLVTPAGEVDLIALDGDTLCLIEVKARRSGRFGTAIEALSPNKQARLIRCGAWLCGALPWYGAIRFDVLTLDRAAEPEATIDGWRLEYYTSAFEAADGHKPSR